MNRIIRDYHREHFTFAECVKYGVLYPAAFFAYCFVAELINRLF